jgi:hypothetical protein
VTTVTSNGIVPRAQRRLQVGATLAAWFGCGMLAFFSNGPMTDHPRMAKHILLFSSQSSSLKAIESDCGNAASVIRTRSSDTSAIAGWTASFLCTRIASVGVSAVLTTHLVTDGRGESWSRCTRIDRRRALILSHF